MKLNRLYLFFVAEVSVQIWNHFLLRGDRVHVVMKQLLAMPRREEPERVPHPR